MGLEDSIANTSVYDSCSPWRDYVTDQSESGGASRLQQASTFKDER